MKVKALALVLLVIFASAAMSFAIGIASNQRSEVKVDFGQSYSVVQIGNGTVVEPDGEPIDTPGGPTQKKI